MVQYSFSIVCKSSVSLHTMWSVPNIVLILSMFYYFHCIHYTCNTHNFSPQVLREYSCNGRSCVCFGRLWWSTPTEYSWTLPAQKQSMVTSSSNEPPAQWRQCHLVKWLVHVIHSCPVETALLSTIYLTINISCSVSMMDAVK